MSNLTWLNVKYDVVYAKLDVADVKLDVAYAKFDVFMKFWELQILDSPDAEIVGALPIFFGKRLSAAGKWLTENAQAIRS